MPCAPPSQLVAATAGEAMAAPGGGGRYGILAPAVQARLFALFDQGSVSLRAGVGRGLRSGARACRRQQGGGGRPGRLCAFCQLVAYVLSVNWLGLQRGSYSTVQCPAPKLCKLSSRAAAPASSSCQLSSVLKPLMPLPAATSPPARHCARALASATTHAVCCPRLLCPRLPARPPRLPTVLSSGF